MITLWSQAVVKLIGLCGVRVFLQAQKYFNWTGAMLRATNICFQTVKRVWKLGFRRHTFPVSILKFNFMTIIFRNSGDIKRQTTRPDYLNDCNSLYPRRLTSNMTHYIPFLTEDQVRVLLLSNRVIQWISAVIVLGINSYLINIGPRGLFITYMEVVVSCMFREIMPGRD